MEYVDGRSLRRYADEEGLDSRQRIELMAKVCDAVNHAHQRGVIHRDLKPGNILVDGSGQPKVLDFGLARMTDADLQASLRTSVGQIVGTLPYMSPEQVAGDPTELDTRSDIYSLGAVLYELLTGRLPQDLRNRPVVEVVRLIQEEDPLSLSRLDASLRGDPETIVAKALEKDKSLSYQSMAELGADLERFLSDRPISAQPPSSLYHLRKFARRNRALVGGVATTMLALTGGAIASSILAFREKRQRERAEIESRTARRVTDFMVGLFERSNPENGNPERISLRQALDLGAGSARTELEAEPAVKARVLGAIGASYLGLNLFAESLELLNESLETYRRLPDADPVALARYMVNLSGVHGAFETDAHHRESVGLLGEAIRILRPLVSEKGRAEESAHLLGNAYNGLGGTYAYGFDRARIDEAIPAFKRAIRYNELAHGRGHVNVAWSYQNVGDVYLLKRKWAKARPMLEKGLAIAESVVGREHIAYATIEMNLADALIQLGEVELAAPRVAHATATLESILGTDHMRVARARRFQGLVAFMNGDLEEAERRLREPIRIATALAGPRFAMNIYNKTYLGDLMAHTGRAEEARRLYREALDVAGIETGPGEDLRRRLDRWGVEPSAAFGR